MIFLKLKETEDRGISSSNPHRNDDLQNKERVKGSRNEENVELLIVPEDNTNN